MIDSVDLHNNQLLELRRGTLVLAALSQLHKPHYGYELLQKLSNLKVDIDAGTLYALLRRLEKQQVLLSAWDTTDVRPRKYYQLSPKGKVLYEHLRQDWLSVSENITNLISKES